MLARKKKGENCDRAKRLTRDYRKCPIYFSEKGGAFIYPFLGKKELCHDCGSLKETSQQFLGGGKWSAYHMVSQIVKFHLANDVLSNRKGISFRYSEKEGRKQPQTQANVSVDIKFLGETEAKRPSM